MEYTLGLALEDFAPVLLSFAGMWLVAGMVGKLHSTAGQAAKIAAVLIGTGGLLKATWKLIIASTGNDLAWMDNSLFVFLAPGFTLMAAALWAGQRGLKGRGVNAGIWAIPLGIIAIFGIGAWFTAQNGGRTWVFVLLGLTTLANTITSLLLIRQARWNSLSWVAGFFALNLLLIYILSGMARIDPQTIPLQWTEQIINTLSQGAFLLASWRLAKTVG